MHSVAESSRRAGGAIRVIGAAVLFAVSISPAGCGGGDEITSTTTETAVQADQIRHDLEPLTKRFPEIGHPVSAAWMSGTVGAPSDSRVTAPGPSIYWIDAIIELEPATADALRSKYAPSPTGEVPNLNESLQPEVPAGPFLTSKALDTALSNNDWRSAAYLHSGSNTLVMRSVDD
ncbi:hypothetical protein ABQF34_26000 [Mycolicibacterium boenickei]